MKNYFFIFLFIVSVNSFAQDTLVRAPIETSGDSVLANTISIKRHSFYYNKKKITPDELLTAINTTHPQYNAETDRLKNNINLFGKYNHQRQGFLIVGLSSFAIAEAFGTLPALGAGERGFTYVVPVIFSAIGVVSITGCVVSDIKLHRKKREIKKQLASFK